MKTLREMMDIVESAQVEETKDRDLEEDEELEETEDPIKKIEALFKDNK